ncbi:sirohydrochlorin chelatase [Streptomyces sp. DvalAA-19]|uniref:sirohydrochlorin chelatase n=1 Tax=Streptomyces sp. DvalAA-19 TaxID=1839761 RepID=UPI00081AEEB6|nr:sirohydrochlorin chelatase [Streptomyces sp. DvalAA-19]SCD30386.1 Sirohydrochlorin ferrochelatase [Streptomyces sp. DvalAA-19]
MTEPPTQHSHRPPHPPSPPPPFPGSGGTPGHGSHGHSPTHGHATVPLDSTAQLLTRVTAQLSTQLSLVSRNGTRRPMDRTRPPAAAGGPPTLLVVAHGSRDPRALRTVLALLDRVRDLRPGLDVRLGHIELNRPLLPDTLDGLRGADAVLVPLLLGRGHHVKHDLPAAAAAAPFVRTRIAAPLGPHALLVEALYGRLVEAGWDAADQGDRRTAVVLAAAGSRDPDSAQDTRRTARMLEERLGGVPVVPAYASAATPTVPAALRRLAARGRHRTFVASYFTAPGRFASAAAGAAPRTAALPLGAHPAMARLLLHRYDQAVSATAPAEAVRLLASA